MMTHRLLPLAVPVLALATLAHAAEPALTSPAPVVAEAVPAAPVAPCYERYDADGAHGGSGDYELLSRRFRNAKTGDVVTITGMIHVADAAFYQKVNALARQHDVVLLEGVKGDPTFAGLPLMYEGMLAERLIGPARLEGQMEQLDQVGPRYRDADVDEKDLDMASSAPAEFAKLPFVALPGESVYTLSGLTEHLFWMTGNGTTYAKGTRALMASAFTLHTGDKPDKEEGLKKAVLQDRNTAVLKVLDEELAKSGAHRVLIPWGAKHGPGLEAGLLKRGFKAENDEWFRAVAVKHLDTSPETDPGFRWQLPYVACIRVSDTTTDLSGPLGLVTYLSTPKRWGHSSAWGLLHRRHIMEDGSECSVLAGLLWTSECNTQEATDEAYALIGLWGRTHTPTSDGTRLGWWGFLGGASEKKDATGAETSREWHLPLAFGADHPLLYGRTTDTKTGKVTHRFLGFFESVEE